MILSLFAIFSGIAILGWSANHFVTGSAALADNLNVSPLLIGLTIVGFGTSAPEILVSISSAMDGNSGLAIGNALGSNIANIGLILGISAIITPLTVHSGVLRREYPLLLVVSCLSLVLMFDGILDLSDGLILLGALFMLLLILIQTSKNKPNDPLREEFNTKIPHGMPTGVAVTRLLIGLASLLISAQILVWGAVDTATRLGISDLVIGLTIVALGTSLPELATTITSSLKQKPDIAIGNIIGSNLYNLLAVLSMPALIEPGPFLDEALYRDQPMMLGLTLALFFMLYGFGKQGSINQFSGLLLFLSYLGYQTLIFFTLSNT